MKEFDLIKKAWDGQKPSAALSAADIIAAAKARKRKFANKIIVQVVSLLAACVGGVFMVNMIHFKMITTFIGVGLMFVTILGFSGLKLYELVRLKQIDFTSEPKKVLHQLREFYGFRKFVNTTCTGIYFILLNLAFLFYFIETLQPMATVWIWITIMAYTAWMLFGYFILRKRQMKKDAGQIEEMINAVNRLGEAFND